MEVGNNVWRESVACVFCGKTVELEFFMLFGQGEKVIYLSTLSFQLQMLRNFEWQANLLSISLWHAGRRGCDVLQGHTRCYFKTK